MEEKAAINAAQTITRYYITSIKKKLNLKLNVK